MPKATSLRAKGKGAKKSVLPPPPPPVILRVNTVEELNSNVLSCAGAALVVVVSSLTPSTTDAVIAWLEHFNSNRPPLLAEAAFVVVYALPSTTAVCHALQVSSLPFTRSYAYGDVVGDFAGDNVEKMELLAKMAATAAAQKAEQLAAELEKQQQQGVPEAGNTAVAANA